MVLRATGEQKEEEKRELAWVLGRSGDALFDLTLCWRQVQWGTLLKARYNFLLLCNDLVITKASA